MVLGIPVFQLGQAVVLPVFATLAAGRAVTFALLGLVAVVAIPVRILDWQHRVFSFDGEVLRIDSGVLRRSTRSIDVGRIQQVEIRRGVVQRLFGLAAIRVETAGSATEPEVDLRVILEDDAVALRAAVRASKARQRGSSPDVASGDPDGEQRRDGVEVVRVPLRHVALASVTGARLLVLPAVVAGALQLLTQQLGTVLDTRIGDVIDAGLARSGDRLPLPEWGPIAVLVVLALVLAVLAAVTTGVLRDGNFRAVLRDGDLHVTRGLLATNESVVPLTRIQLVEVRRNWLRRVLGYSTLRIRSAGGAAGGDGQVNVPLLPDAAVAAVLVAILPGSDGVPALTSHPPAARRRAMVRWSRWSAGLVGGAWLSAASLPFLDPSRTRPILLLTLLLLPAAVGLAIVEYRQLGNGRTELLVAARRGALSVVTTLAPVVKVQAVTTRSSVFQRRLGLATLVAHVAGPGAVVGILDAGGDEVAALHAALTRDAAAPRPRVAPGPVAGPA